MEELKTFEKLLENFYGKPFQMALSQFTAEEDDVVIDWGEARGEELEEYLSSPSV